MTTLTAGATTVTIEPTLGARITSIRMLGVEWLQQPVEQPRPARPFDEFVRPGLGGWDEMVPTCVPCELDGIALPDHGEAWSSPWTVAHESDSRLTCRFDGAIVPSRLSRTVDVTAAGIQIDYELSNVGPGPVPAFWMAHPLFDAADLVEARLHPVPATRKVTVSSVPDAVEPLGALLPRDIEAGGYRKYRFGAPDEVTAVSLHRRDGTALRIEWSADVPLHLQWWCDHAGIGPSPAVAPEPATAFGDDPVTARAAGALPMLDPGQHLTIQLRVSATDADARSGEQR